MIREAIEALGGKTTNVAIRDWIQEHYPDTNKNTIQCQIIVCTVNHFSRVHYPEGKKPRRADTQYDFLFRPSRGQVELYDPKKHGHWEIYQREDSRFDVRQIDADAIEQNVLPTGVDAGNEKGSAFAAEGHLRDYLVKHLDQIEPGLELYVDEEGTTGVEYIIRIGRIDILAMDSSGDFVVIELKVSRGPDSVAGQVLRYKNWVKKHLAEGQVVRGIIIAQHISEKVQYAILGDSEISTIEYEINLVFRHIPAPSV